MIRKCLECGKEVKLFASEIKNGRGKFCSKRCHGVSLSKVDNRIQKECPVCKKKFKIWPYMVKDKVGKFCSRKCKGKWQSDNLKGKNNPLWSGRIEIRICVVCNKHFLSRRRKDNNNITWGKYCSRKCFGIDRSKRFFKETSFRWKNNSTVANRLARQTEQYKTWRKLVYERDGYICRDCGIDGDGKNLNAHHLKSFSGFPELRFDVNNGITLCVFCHCKIHGRDISFGESAKVS